MTNFTIGLIALAAVMILMFLGVPISFAFGLSSLAGLAAILGFGKALTYLGTVPFNSVASYTFCVMPLFMLMGDIAVQAGLTSDAFDAARKWFGRLPGGLAITSTVASAIFGAVCGSGTATALIMTQVAYPEMKRHRYADELSLGSIAAAAPLAILIPPSVPLIMFGIQSGASISQLFMGGIGAGVLICILLSVWTIISCVLHPDRAGGRDEKIALKEKLKALRNVWAILLLILIIIGGIWGGFCTANEAAGFGAFGALLIAAIRRRTNPKEFWKQLRLTCISGGSMFFLFVGVQMFNYLMTFSGIPKALANWVRGMNLSGILVIVVVMIIYLILGCFMDSPPIIMLTTAIFAPMVEAYGYSLIWFGVLVAITVGIGAITPPVGINLFIINSRVDTGLQTIIRGVLPYIVIMLIGLVVCIVFPDIIMFLPNMMPK